MFRIVLLFLIQATSISINAQWYNPDKLNKKVAAINEKAYNAAMDGDYATSLTLLGEAIAMDDKFVDGYLSRAGIYAEQKKYGLSVIEFEKAFALDSIYSVTYFLPYSISLAGTGAFDRALDAIRVFLSITTLNEQSKKAGLYRKKSYEFALDFAKEHATASFKFSPVNLGSGINTSNHEYFPAITINGEKIIFNRRINNDEDFFESNLINGKWSEASPLQGKINTNLNEGAQTVSQDGELLIFTGCNYPEGLGSCDLYLAYKMKNGSWSEPDNMGPSINSEFWESSPSLSPDKKDLYFSSNRPGGFGGKDIWISHKLANGKWSEPENAGNTINTPADEGCPFIHADNTTLYFISNGHVGYGVNDIFKSLKTENGWQTPLNLGYPINTIDDEGSLIVAADGKTAFYASDRTDSKGLLDLYSFTMPEYATASKTLWVKGKVFNKKNGAGLPSAVELKSIKDNKTKSLLQTDEEGNYLVTLPAGREYAFTVNRKGFLFYSAHFKITNSDTARTIDIGLSPIEAGSTTVLRNIFFSVKDYTLNPESFDELNKVVQLMKDNPGITALITGHTDDDGKPEDNLLLSNKRAKAVADYIVAKGINQSRVQCKGFGETKPIASNTNEEGKSLNRRTELIVTGVK